MALPTVPHGKLKISVNKRREHDFATLLELILCVFAIVCSHIHRRLEFVSVCVHWRVGAAPSRGK
jgi:hypothetical protein